MAGSFTHLIFAKQIAANYPHTIDWKRWFATFAAITRLTAFTGLATALTGPAIV